MSNMTSVMAAIILGAPLGLGIGHALKTIGHKPSEVPVAQQADGVAIGASCKLLGMNVTVNHVYKLVTTGSVDVITGSLRVITVKRKLLKQCASEGS